MLEGENTQTTPPTEPPAPPVTPPAGGQVTLEQYNGMKGALKQAQGELSKFQATYKGEKDAYEARLAELQTTINGLQAQIAEAGTFKTKAGELEGEIAKHTGANSRLRTLMKYPQLLGDEAAVLLAENFSGNVEDLDKALAAFAGRLSAAAAPPPPAGTPPKPPAATGEADPAELMRQANEFALKGDMAKFNELALKALAAQDAKKGAFKPPFKEGAWDAPPLETHVTPAQ